MADQSKRSVEDRLSRANEIYKGWHREASLWREIYARSVATLVAGLIAYLVALIAGQVTIRPLLVIAWAMFGMFALALLRNLAVAVPIWRHVTPLFRRWNDDQSAEGIRAKRVYLPLLLSFYGSVVFGVLSFLLLYLGVG